MPAGANAEDHSGNGGGSLRRALIHRLTEPGQDRRAVPWMIVNEAFHNNERGRVGRPMREVINWRQQNLAAHAPEERWGEAAWASS